MIILESRFKTKLISKLYKMFPDCLVVHPDPVEIQGLPDLLILYKDKWAALEGKRHNDSTRRPNQEYYIKLMNTMSFASFICPENEEEVLHELQRSFTSGRDARVSKSK